MGWTICCIVERAAPTMPLPVAMRPWFLNSIMLRLDFFPRPFKCFHVHALVPRNCVQGRRKRNGCIQVKKLTDQHKEHCAQFYYYLCVLIESDVHEAMKSMFPGTWSRHAGNSLDDGARRGGEGELADQTASGEQQGAEEPRRINYLPTPLPPHICWDID